MSCNTGTPNVNKTFIIEPQSMTGATPVLSACTALFTNMLVPCTGDTVTFNGNIYVDGSVSGDTFYGDGSNLIGIEWSGNTSGNCIADIFVSNIYGCSPVTFHNNVIFNGETEPDSDNIRTLGTPVKRFREINVYSGNTTVWNVTQKVVTPSLELGFDSSGNTRTITANNSIVQDDTLVGGSY